MSSKEGGVGSAGSPHCICGGAHSDTVASRSLTRARPLNGGADVVTSLWRLRGAETVSLRRG